MQHVFIVGSKSLGAYGGYETFVYKLTEYHQNKKNIKYHVACKANGDGCMDETKVDGVTRINDHEFEFHNAHCFKIDIPQIGPAQAIYYDVAALKACCKYIKEHQIKHPIVYIMACRIGPFAGHFYKEIHKLGGTVYLNPDGHEWMRAKWSAPIRKYWKISEQMMVKYCDLAICDSVNIEKYIHECYDGKSIRGRNPKTTFIAYGADLTLSKLADDDEKSRCTGADQDLSGFHPHHATAGAAVHRSDDRPGLCTRYSRDRRIRIQSGRRGRTAGAVRIPVHSRRYRLGARAQPAGGAGDGRGHLLHRRVRA